MASNESIVAPSTGMLSMLPLEIRRMIYKEIWAPKMNMHVFFQGDRLSVRPCLGANMGDEKNLDTRYPSKEECDLRWEKKPSKSDNFWLTRLSSSWGNHYLCEEDWMPHPDHPSSEKNSCISMLLACRQMYTECLDIIHESLDLHISDMETAMYLISDDSQAPKSTTEHPAHVIPRSIIQSARSVNLTLFQPPEFYVALDMFDKVPQDWEPKDEELEKFRLGTLWKDLLKENMSKAPQWGQLWDGLAALPHLMNVNLWMDHNQPQSWSYINERAVLQPIRQASWDSKTKLAVHLPNLCQDKVSKEAHFNPEDGTLPFQIRRRYRCPTRPERDWWGCSYEPDISDEEMVEMANEYGADPTNQQWTAITVIVSELENRCYKAVDITTRLPEKVRKTFHNTQARLGYGK